MHSWERVALVCQKHLLDHEPIAFSPRPYVWLKLATACVSGSKDPVKQFVLKHQMMRKSRIWLVGRRNFNILSTYRLPEAWRDWWLPDRPP
jgi:hypothetical protein